MKTMKITITLFGLFMSLTLYSLAQTKHALLIGVGTYPERTQGGKWGNLSSENDILLVNDMLIGQGFSPQNIKTLLNEKATAKNAMVELDALLLRLKKGDVVYVHYSGHGQQVADVKKGEFPNLKFVEKDEIDGYDEALAMYDAAVYYYNGYDYSGHLIDDQLDYYVTKIEEAIGDKGHLVMVLDACHSGTGTRGTPSTRRRGSSSKCEPEDYTPDYTAKDKKNFSEANSVNGNGIKTIFMGCKNDEVNYEMEVNGKGYGSLTYAMVEAVSGLKSTASYQNVFKIVFGKLLDNSAGNQHADIESEEVNSLFFGGATVPFSENYRIKEVISASRIRIAGGMVHGINVGDSIGITPLNSNSTEMKVLEKGVVVEVLGSESIVEKKDIFKKVNKANYAQFLSKRTYEVFSGQRIKVLLDTKDNKELTKKIKNLLVNDANIELIEGKETKDPQQRIDYIVKADKNGKVIIELPHTRNPFKRMEAKDLSVKENQDTLVLFLHQALKLDYFNQLELTDPKIKIDVTFSEFTNDEYLKIVENYAAYLGKNNNMKALKVKIKNNSSRMVYVYALHLSNTKEVSVIDLDRNNKFLELNPNIEESVEDKFIFACQDSVDCGLDKLFFFASPEKMDFSVIEELGKTAAITRGAGDAFAKLIADGSEGKTRGANAVSGVHLVKVDFEYSFPIPKFKNSNETTVTPVETPVQQVVPAKGAKDKKSKKKKNNN